MGAAGPPAVSHRAGPVRACTGGTPSGALAVAIDALRDCGQASNACAMAMVEAGGMAAEVHRALDCADLCEASGRVLSRSPVDQRLVAAVVEACIAACEASASACGAHAEHHGHCRLHSASAYACADALRGLRKALVG